MDGMVSEGPPGVNPKLEAELLALWGYAINEGRCLVPGVRFQEVGNRNKRLEREAGSQKAEAGSQKSEVGSQSQNRLHSRL